MMDQIGSLPSKSLHSGKEGVLYTLSEVLRSGQFSLHHPHLREFWQYLETFLVIRARSSGATGI